MRDVISVVAEFMVDGAAVEAQLLRDVISVVAEFMVDGAAVEAQLLRDAISVVAEFMVDGAAVEAQLLRDPRARLCCIHLSYPLLLPLTVHSVCDVISVVPEFMVDVALPFTMDSSLLNTAGSIACMAEDGEHGNVARV
jgi:hypothetical protein